MANAESIYQSVQLKANVYYSFSIDLSHDPNTQTGKFPGGLKIYASNSSCNNTSKLLWNSKQLKKSTWEKFDVSFTPDADYSQITFVNSIDSTSAVMLYYILIDNIRPNTFALPLQLISFKANKANNQVQLSWQTASEKNLSHFEVQESRGDNNFQSIGIIKAIGNSQVLKDYQFSTKFSASKNSSYYRLKMVDKSGAFSYSSTQTIISQKHALFQKSENAWEFTAQENTVYKIEMYDLYGSKVFVGNFTESIQLPFNQFPASMYLVKILNSDSTISTYKLIK